MKKDCAYTRKSLRKYLHGHLFKPEQIRVERHLRSCVMCYTEYQALKQAAETKQYLKDITPPEGIVQRVQAGVSGLAKLKKILYRPLWLAHRGIVPRCRLKSASTSSRTLGLIHSLLIAFSTFAI